jgi:hypothetical protein
MITYCQKLSRINDNTEFYVLATLFDKFSIITKWLEMMKDMKQ